jgi:hypothetical protein
MPNDVEFRNEWAKIHPHLQVNQIIEFDVKIIVRKLSEMKERSQCTRE